MTTVKLSLTVLVASVSLTTAWSNTESPASSTPAKSTTSSVLSVGTTAYSHHEADHIPWGQKNAIGTTLRSTTQYNSAAADWSRFPVGTKFRIKGNPKLYVVDDYGSALVGTSTIDLYCVTMSEMDKWGRRNVDIQIVEWGSYERSREILKARTANTSCAKMYRALKGKEDA